MTRWRPDLALARLAAALEAEILAAPEAEIRAAIREAGGRAAVEAVRAVAAGAADRAEEGAGLGSPDPRDGPPAHRRQ